MRQLGPFSVLILWAALCVGAGFYGFRLGYGGRGFAATLAAFAYFLAVALLFAAKGASDSFHSRLGFRGGAILGITTCLAYCIYSFGTHTFAPERAVAVAGLVFTALSLAASAKEKVPGAWQDWFILLGLWVFVKFSPGHWIWSYPNGHLAYVLTVLLAVNMALASLVLVRRLDGIGYFIGWGPRWGFYVLASFMVFAGIAIPLGVGIRFITFAPHWMNWRTLPSVAIAIFLFTAWPEEFLFRGLLQNLISRAWKNDRVGWMTTSLLFGLSHITNGRFPNWRYVILASIAGLFYGWTWRRSGSIFASALVHTTVNTTWRFFFRTL